jgi:spermidine/putrescine transport system substrate-binding protein
MHDPTGDSTRESANDTKQLESLIRDLTGERISRRRFLQRAATLGLSASAAGVVLAACGGTKGETTGGPAGSAPPLDTTPPKRLNLYTWADYTPPSVVKKFEKKYGVKVDISFFDDNEMLLSKLKAGARGYDVIVPSDYMVHILAKTGLLEPLHMDLIPNFAGVAEQFKKPSYDNLVESGGKKFSVPYDWGTTGIGHRKDIVTDAITKWADLWNPKYKGKINMLNDEREVLMSALLMLGYNENCTDQAQLDEATQKLIDQKPLVQAYDSINMKRAVLTGVPLVQGWDGWLLMALPNLGSKRLEYVLPLEGYNLYHDTFAIPVGAPSPYAAHLWMNFMLDPKISAETINWTWYHTPVPAAKRWIGKIVLAFEPDDVALQRAQQEEDLGAFARQWTLAWEKIKSA